MDERIIPIFVLPAAYLRSALDGVKVVGKRGSLQASENAHDDDDRRREAARAFPLIAVRLFDSSLSHALSTKPVSQKNSSSTTHRHTQIDEQSLLAGFHSLPPHL